MPPCWRPRCAWSRATCGQSIARPRAARWHGWCRAAIWRRPAGAIPSIRQRRRSAMIIRAWRAVAGSDAVLAAYADHLRKTTFVGMAELPGHLGATLARKVTGTDNEL